MSDMSKGQDAMKKGNGVQGAAAENQQADAESARKKVQEALAAKKEKKEEEEVLSAAEAERLDEEIQIEVAEDGMSATLYLAPVEKSEVFKTVHLKALLREKGIVFGLDEEKLEEIISQKKYFETFVIAEGQSAENGEDGWFEFLFPTELDNKPKILKDGSVDYSSCGNVPSVEEGEEIVRYHPPTKAKDGMDVHGTIVAGMQGKDLPRLKGRGFILSEDNLTYTARVTGKATYQNEQLIVNSELTIDGDVAYATTGDIRFVGDIHVLGNVLAGMSVVSEKGGIIVDGYVEAATLVAKKDIVLKNGMQGNGTGKIATAGSVSGKFFEQSFVDCDGTVAANAIMNSHITCGEDILVSGRFGAIIGGSVSAMHVIETRIVGNMSEVHTDIVAGIAGDLRTMLAQCEKTEKRIQEEIEPLNEAIKKIEAMIENNPTPSLNEKKLKLTRAKIDKVTRLHEIFNKKQELTSQIEKAKEAKVTILKRVFPGTKITINGMTVNVDEEIAQVEYTRRGTGIISYHLT